jgi:hypothetical protein
MIDLVAPTLFEVLLWTPGETEVGSAGEHPAKG